MIQENICVQCGIGIEEQKIVRKSGKAFCSDSCASEHTKRSEGRRGCCC